MRKKYILLILILCSGLMAISCTSKMTGEEYAEFEKGMHKSIHNLTHVTSTYLSKSDDWDNRSELYESAKVYYDSISGRLDEAEKRIPKDKQDEYNNVYSKVRTDGVLLLSYVMDIDYNSDKKEKAKEILNHWAEMIDYSLEISVEPVYKESESNELLEEILKNNKEQEDSDNLISPLNIEDIELIFEDDYMYFTGYVKNTGDRVYSFIKIKAIYYDDSDNIIDTDWTYAVSSEGISPNERKSFKIMTSRTKNITKGSLSILDYQ